MSTMTHCAVSFVSLLLVSGCQPAPGSSNADMALSPLSQVVKVDLPVVGVPAGGELIDQCVSYTLHNDAALNINRVEMTAGPAWHHSNWFFVVDSMYDGPDAAWPCADRGFEEFKTGANGGILFAQSTQA